MAHCELLFSFYGSDLEIRKKRNSQYVKNIFGCVGAIYHVWKNNPKLHTRTVYSHGVHTAEGYSLHMVLICPVTDCLVLI